jgi:hypothetical protein
MDNIDLESKFEKLFSLIESLTVKSFDVQTTTLKIQYNLKNHLRKMLTSNI